MAGKRGAEKLAAALAEARIPCRLLYPPEPHKDLREWLRDGGLKPMELAGEIEKASIRYPDGWTPGFQQIPRRAERAGGD